MKTIILNNQTRVLVPDDAMAVRIYVDTIEQYSPKRYESLSKKAQKKIYFGKNSRLSADAKASLNLIVRFNRPHEDMYVEIKESSDYNRIGKSWGTNKI